MSVRTIAAILVGVAGIIAVPAAALAGDGAPFSTAQASAGRAIYESRCAECHAADLTGGKGTPLKGPAFNGKWHDQPVRALYSKTRSTMPPDDPGSLSESEALAVTAYLLSQNPRGLTNQATPTAAGLAGRRLELR